MVRDWPSRNGIQRTSLCLDLEEKSQRIGSQSSTNRRAVSVARTAKRVKGVHEPELVSVSGP